MLPVILQKNQGVATTENLVGLGGFWGRLAKKLIQAAIGVVKQIPIAGPLIGEEIERRVIQWTGNYGADMEQGTSFWNRGGQDYEPTPAEEAILLDWHNSKFLPFYKTMVAELNIGLKLSTIPAQIEAINVAMAKMMIGRDWHKTNATVGLSADAVGWRHEYIQSAFKPVFDIITETLLPYEFDDTAMWLPDIRTTASAALTNINYSPLISGIPSGLFANQYYIRGLVPNSPMVPGYITTPTTPPVLPPPPTTPVTPPATTTPTAPTTQNPTTPAPAKPAEEKGFFKKYKVPLLAIGAIALLWPEEKKKKKE